MDLSHVYHQGIQNVFAAIEHQALNHLTINPVLAPGGTATNFQISAFSFMLGGVVYNKEAANNIAAPGASTGAGEFRKVLIHINAAGTVAAAAGEIAASQELAKLPATPADTLPIGVIELPASFTSGTTNVTAGMCKPWTHAITVVN